MTLLVVIAEFVVGVAACVTVAVRWPTHAPVSGVLVYLAVCILAAVGIGATVAVMS